MKAISGYSEWFYAMALNVKPVENRGWSLYKYFKKEELPVTVFLHGSRTPAKPEEVSFIRHHLGPKYREQFDAVDFNKLRGVLFAVITITGEITKKDVGHPVFHSPWFFGEYGFLVTNGRILERPIPLRGQLNFFETDYEIK